MLKVEEFFHFSGRKHASVHFNQMLLIFAAYITNAPLSEIDISGVLVQVYLGQDGEVKLYANITIQPNSPIHKDLILDQNGAHIYVMTKNTVSIKM